MLARWSTAFRRHPVLAVLFSLALIGGASAGVVWLPAEWHPARRAAAGALSGLGCALLMTAHRMLG